MFSRREFIRLTAYLGLGTSISSHLVSIPNLPDLSIGEFTLKGHFAQNVAANTITSGDPGGDWQIIGGMLSPTGNRLNREGYRLTLDSGRVISIGVEVDTYSVKPDPKNAGELGIVAGLLEKGVGGDRTIKIAGGDQLWVNSNAFLSNRAFANNVTITSYDINNPVRFLTARPGVSRGELRAPKNIHFISTRFYAHFDRTFHNAVSIGLGVLGSIDNVSFDFCQFEDNQTQIGPGTGFRGLLGGDGTSKIVGRYSITNCSFNGGARCLQLSHRSDTKGMGQITILGNEMRNYGVDGTVFAFNNDNMRFEDNYCHSPYSDPWRTDWKRAHFYRSSLKKAKESQYVTAFIKGNFKRKPGAREVLVDGPLRIERTATGAIKVNCGLVRLESNTKVISNTNYEILLSINTAGSSRLMLRLQDSEGRGDFQLEDRTSVGSQPANLKGAISLGGALDKSARASGYIERIMIWHDIAADVEQRGVQQHFSTTWTDRKLPQDAIAEYGRPIVGFWGDDTEKNAGTNHGTGGDFKVTGAVDNDHGDGLGQGIPGVNYDVVGWKIKRNIFYGGRFDNSPFELNNFQILFLENIANPKTNPKRGYKNLEIIDNVGVSASTIHGISVYNAVDCTIANNTLIAPEEWDDGGSRPTILIEPHFDGETRGNRIVGNIVSFRPNVKKRFGTLISNIVAAHDGKGKHSYADLFDGPIGLPTSKEDLLARFKAKASGPLLAQHYNIGAIGTGYADFEARNSVHVDERFNNV
jgi:hypothetical protein